VSTMLRIVPLIQMNRLLVYAQLVLDFGPLYWVSSPPKLYLMISDFSKL
jgi:hypothetical protein